MSLNKFSQLPDELLDCILNMYWMDKYNIVLDELNNFIPPYSLIEGIEKTITNEFISPDINQEIFYTE